MKNLIKLTIISILLQLATPCISSAVSLLVEGGPDKLFDLTENELTGKRPTIFFTEDLSASDIKYLIKNTDIVITTTGEYAELILENSDITNIYHLPTLRNNHIRDLKKKIENIENSNGNSIRLNKYLDISTLKVVELKGLKIQDVWITLGGSTYGDWLGFIDSEAITNYSSSKISAINFLRIILSKRYLFIKSYPANSVSASWHIPLKNDKNECQIILINPQHAYSQLLILAVIIIIVCFYFVSLVIKKITNRKVRC